MKLVCRTIYIHYIKLKCLRIAAISDSIEPIPSGDKNVTIKIHTTVGKVIIMIPASPVHLVFYRVTTCFYLLHNLSLI